MRDRLIKLFREAKEHPEKTCPKWEAPTCFGCDYNKGDECDRIARLADHLLENGVVMLDTGVISPENRPLIQTVAGMPINEVIELVKAKQSNRVIVPPCKVGDTVYLITTCSYKKQINEYTVNKVEIAQRGRLRITVKCIDKNGKPHFSQSSKKLSVKQYFSPVKKQNRL